MEFSCPWPCMAENPIIAPKAPQQQSTFAQVLSPVAAVKRAPLPQPTVQGDNLSIKITENVYLMGLDKSKYHMHDRIFLNRGDKPYTFSFSSKDDVHTSLAMGRVNLKLGLLRLSQWSKDFNKYSQRLTHAQVWIRLLDLPQDSWLERTLLEIGGAIGTPLIIDIATQKRTFGHYVRVLVDIDFSHWLFYEIMVEREGFAFPIEVEYEWSLTYAHIVSFLDT
ncbi:DUF4283 domain protein [Medicago truncatula]|uniref:DUF4283 domain protein n=1 Tax=Medicago truncatula TaxID=3880 RepID=G7ZX06_MEDTR|nr:DUF4283 domain protein [Medicago truncatula]